MMGIQNGWWKFRMDDGDLEWMMGIQNGYCRFRMDGGDLEWMEYIMEIQNK